MALTEVNSLGIKDLEVKTADIAADAVTGAKIADDQIDSEHYVDGSIDHQHLADDAVDGDIIADNAVGLAHMAGGTDGVIITYDASGDPVHVGPGSDGQVLTSTGAGSPPAFENLPTSGATLSGSTDNTIVTVTGSNAMQGEANLTFDGSNLGVTGGVEFAAANNRLRWKEDSNANSREWAFIGEQGQYQTFHLYAGTADGGVAGSGTNDKEIIRWHNNGNMEIKDGDLIISTAGHGIDFSATGDSGASTTSELLDDYEEGTWTPVIYYYGGGWNTSNVTTAGGTEAYYVKCGRIVHFYLKRTGFEHDSGGDHYAKITGLPYSTGEKGFAVVTYSQAFTANNEDATALISAGGIEFYRGTSWLLWSTSSNRQLYLSGSYEANA